MIGTYLLLVVLIDSHLNGTEHSKQQSILTDDPAKQQPSKNGIFNFILPSEGDCPLNPDENLEPNSTGLKSSRTRGVWHKCLGENDSAQIKERSLLGHLVCSEVTQKKILELDIFRILKSEGVTGIGALCKFSPSKFVLVFGLKMAKEKLAGTEFQCRFGESEIKLNFPKRVGPLRNGKEPTLVNIFLPEFISNQAVRLAFSKFGEVVSVFKGRHDFNRKIRNGKRYVKIFPAGGDPTIPPRKISFHGSVQRDVLFPEKVVLCYRYKTRHMLGENCPVATPTPKDSHMSFIEQSESLESLLGKVWLLRSLTLLLRLSPLLSLSRSPYLLRRGLMGKILRRKRLALTLFQGQLQGQAMKLTLNWSPLCRKLLCRNPSVILLKRTYLQLRRLRIILSRLQRPILTLWGIKNQMKQPQITINQSVKRILPMTVKPRNQN